MTMEDKQKWIQELKMQRNAVVAQLTEKQKMIEEYDRKIEFLEETINKDEKKKKK